MNKLTPALIAAALAVPAASAAITTFDLKPSDINPADNKHFSTLPTQDPSLFGFSGFGVRTIDFDTDLAGNPIADGTILNNQFAPLGVTLDNSEVFDSVWQGPASNTNAIARGGTHTFTFTVPVDRVGIINTSPDHDLVEIFSGPNATGTLLASFNDGGNATRDRFLGAQTTGGDLIGSIRLTNNNGWLELDDLVFQTPIPAPGSAAIAGLAGVLAARRRR